MGARDSVYTDRVFRHEGPARDPKLNARIAGYLAAIAGFVNSSGALLLGTFTSHVTGSIGRLSTDLAAGHVSSAALALLLVIGFFLGAFLASVVLEGSAARSSYAYGLALALQAGLLALFVAVTALYRTTTPYTLDAEAAVLCCAMGMQNSLVTRLSGAVVRTTHLTGIVTDLGIEAARWYRWRHARVAAARDAENSAGAERPPPAKSVLLLTILLAFSSGALVGAFFTLRFGSWAMTAPTAATGLLSLYAFSQRFDAHPPAR